MSRLPEFALRHWPLFLALAAVLALLVGNEVQRRLRGLRKVGPAEAVRLMNRRGALVLDVRTEGEFQEGHIPEARHLPPAAIEEQVRALEKHKGRPVVVYCRSGTRSARVGGILRRHGFEEVFDLDGGLGAWQNANLPVHRASSGRRKK